MRTPIITWILVLWSTVAIGQSDLLTLDIGSVGTPASIDVPLDAILDLQDREIVSVQSLRARLRDAAIVLVGEQHTDTAHHAVELRVLELLRDVGQPIVVALEMTTADLDPVLDAWTRGELDEADLVDRSDWYATWGYDWRYYRDIFLFAREHGVPIVGLRGRSDDTDTTVEPDLDSVDHETLLRAFFEGDSPFHGGLSDQQFASLFEAQSRRDAQMARRVLDARRTYPERTIVVFAGIGHVLYGLGIARQLPAAERPDVLTIVPVPVADGAASTPVATSVGDFAWGIPESANTAYPELGALMTATTEGLRVIFVEPASPAADAGIVEGDVLTHYEGRPLSDRPALGRALASAQWGDEIALALRRDGVAQVVRVALRRRTPD